VMDARPPKECDGANPMAEATGSKFKQPTGRNDGQTDNLPFLSYGIVPMPDETRETGDLLCIQLIN